MEYVSRRIDNVTRRQVVSTINDYAVLATALGLGLVVGLQREWRESDVAGIRTFPMITLLGAICAMIGRAAGPSLTLAAWPIAAGLIAVALMLVVANVAKVWADVFDFGMTTEVAALVMFSVGAALALGIIGPSIVITGIVAVLLHFKDPLHGFVKRMAEKDVRAVIHLALIALVILPLLPDRAFGPYSVLNPFKIWQMVVLIVGISMAAYVAYRIMGASSGAILGGVLGGLISSTATTVSFARLSARSAEVTPLATLVILIASTIVNVRVLVEIGIVSPALLSVALLPLGVMTVVMVIESAIVYFQVRHHEIAFPEQDNPAQLKAAIAFGGLYAVILFLVAAAKEHFGDQALYVIAMISGLTDVDAITLSTAELFNEGRVDASTGWRVVVLATLSNLVFKAGAVAILGNRRLFRSVLLLFAIALVVGLTLILYWP